ncbi:MAG: hypothetical protein ACTHK0_04110 [Ginsengibacter sp.]
MKFTRTKTLEIKVSKIGVSIIGIVGFSQMAYGQGFVQVGNSTFRLPEPSAEYRIKKLIICLFADRIPCAGTADDSSTNADVYSFSPTCTVRDSSCII